MHNRLILDLSIIPESIKDINVNSGFYDGLFNLDGSKRQLDGYLIDDNEDVISPKTLCHLDAVLLYWCRNESDPSAAVNEIKLNAVEIKPSDYFKMRGDPNSEWYVEEEII